jgi:formyltetrahydrofolate deformylase
MYILRLFCDDKPRIVASVATALADHACNIEDSNQFHDHLSGQFFWRCVFSVADPQGLDAFMQAFEQIAARFAMDWQISPVDQAVRAVILVSKEDHCLNDLLYRWRVNALNIDITAIISNHEAARSLADIRGIPFHHLPVTAENKAQQEAALRRIIADTDAELIILARYMQVLSDPFCRDFGGRVINIHHSFLPGFKGAKPYHQAYARGVKMVGATAHFATTDLDEGPIIAQDVMPIDHSLDPKKLQAAGRDNEARTLARAVKLYTERRIFLHGNRTVIL